MAKTKETKFLLPSRWAIWGPVAVAALFALLLVSLNQLKGFDTGITGLVQKLPHSLLGSAMLISNMATTPVLIEVAAIWALAELTMHRRDRAVAMLTSLIALPAYQVAKLLVHRARPVTQFVAQAGLHGDSFPSGHAAGSFAVYLMLAYLTYRQTPAPWNKVSAIVFSSLVVVVALSRIYLGAHFPTDVLGGWLLSLFVLLIIRQFVVRYEQKQHRVGSV